MATRLTSSLVSKRLSSISAFSSGAAAAAAAAAAVSAHNAASTSSNTSARTAAAATAKRQRKPHKPRIEATHLGLRRSFAQLRSERDLRLELFFHVPGYSELQRLRVHRSLSLVSLQALLQREFNVPFEDQRLYFQGELLEGNDDLPCYELLDQSVVNVRIRKRYRNIGDVFTAIRVVRFAADAAAPVIATTTNALRGPSAATATRTLDLSPGDYEVVEVVAALPPLRVVIRRLGIAIAYITALDRMQNKHTGRRVWQQLHAAPLWAEPGAGTKYRSSPQPAHPSTLAGTRAAAIDGNDSTSRTVDDTASFVMRKCSSESVSTATTTIATATRARLQIAPDARSAADVRHIRKWLGSVRYFATAGIPDAACYEIAKSCVYEQYNAGAFIFRQDDVGDVFYILISGTVSLAAYGNGYFATMTPGMCFGEISLFEANGVRTASAHVNFGASNIGAELAVLSGDVYRRVILPFKQAVLHRTEQAVYAVPQLRALPDHVVTHIAYAGKSLTAKTGKQLIRHGDDLRVLVLLVAGEVKVSTPLSVAARQRRDADSTAASVVPLLKASSNSSSNESVERSYPVVSVVRAPAVFGQESCLSNTPRPAPWDIDALDTCTLVCLRMDTISIFLASQHDIVRALMAEHERRVEAFRRRFEQFAVAAAQQQQQQSLSRTSNVNHQASYLQQLTSSRRLSATDATVAVTPSSPVADTSNFVPPRQQRVAPRIAFPTVLMRGDSVGNAALSASAVHATRSPRAPTASAVHKTPVANLNLHRFLAGSHRVANGPHPHEPQQFAVRAQTAPPSCAAIKDEFLHEALPFRTMLDLREQLQFVSFEQQQRDWNRQQRCARRPDADEDNREHAHAEAKTQALLRGLRKLEAQDVALVAPLLGAAARTRQPHAQFRFTPVAPTVNT